MVRALLCRRALTICAVTLALGTWSAPAWAQSGVKGKVVDKDNKPIEGAKITITNLDVNRTIEVKTNKKGEYIQIGLQGGNNYRVTAEKDGMSQTFTDKVGLDLKEINFVLKPGQVAPMSKEEAAKQAAKMDAVQKAFEEGVALGQAEKYDEGIAKFTEILVTLPKCAECYTNIGALESRRKNWDAAEAAYKKSLEIKPDNADVYNGLATVYNAQKKFDQATEASAMAAKLAGAAGPGGTGGASASAVFNQGVIFWNQSKIPEAKKQFEEAIKLDANLADAHYWLGMALVNENKLPEAATEFETYLKLAPTGANAPTAKSMLAAIKK